MDQIEKTIAAPLCTLHIMFTTMFSHVVDDFAIVVTS